MGACVQVDVDAQGRQGICAHDKQKKKALSEERYAKRKHDE